MDVEHERVEPLFDLAQDEQMFWRSYRGKIALSVVGFCGLFCLALTIGFLNERQVNARVDAHFQARRAVDLWDLEVKKRDSVIRVAERSVPEWGFDSPLVRGAYLQRKIAAAAPVEAIEPFSLEKFPALRDFQEITRLALKGEWREAFISGDLFLKTYHRESLLQRGEQRDFSMVDLSLDEVLVPIQYLRQVAFAREMKDLKAERKAIEDVARACSYEDVTKFLDEEHPLNKVHVMFEYCFSTLAQGSVSLRTYFSERLHLIQEATR
ncbi:hypothetical protein [Candidatus Similichlamydia laticola]|uniref:Uncharacterized protein n=1 Tax=Candidatus Similichlamydia laticola TaxID=2170265 RepID=A0A369K9K6_9BACT|nr:hypothetical protein [Candidatus Similichlamydia laticola]RDB31271.1 hypothetical protein HAT2_00639 [Candidatus Similichlamydia laticola]